MAINCVLYRYLYYYNSAANSIRSADRGKQRAFVASRRASINANCPCNRDTKPYLPARRGRILNFSPSAFGSVGATPSRGFSDPVNTLAHKISDTSKSRDDVAESFRAPYNGIRDTECNEREGWGRCVSSINNIYIHVIPRQRGLDPISFVEVFQS